MFVQRSGFLAAAAAYLLVGSSYAQTIEVDGETVGELCRAVLPRGNHVG